MFFLEKGEKKRIFTKKKKTNKGIRRNLFFFLIFPSFLLESLTCSFLFFNMKEVFFNNPSFFLLRRFVSLLLSFKKVCIPLSFFCFFLFASLLFLFLFFILFFAFFFSFFCCPLLVLFLFLSFFFGFM